MSRLLKTALAALLLLLPTTAVAQSDFCEELWVNRNLIFDRAGYCFGSALGQSVFDNSACTTQAPDLDAMDQAAVALIREGETIAGCAVDTGRTALGTAAMDVLQRLRVLSRVPGRDHLESACIGFNGPTFALRSGPSDSAPVIGEGGPGVTVAFSYLPVGDWSYVTTHLGTGTMLAHGYVPTALFEAMPCRQMTG